MKKLGIFILLAPLILWGYLSAQGAVTYGFRNGKLTAYTASQDTVYFDMDGTTAWMTKRSNGTLVVATKDTVIAVIDSTGMTVYGEINVDSLFVDIIAADTLEVDNSKGDAGYITHNDFGQIVSSNPTRSNEQRLGYRTPRTLATFTFDDYLPNAATKAMMNSLGAVGTVYIITGNAINDSLKALYLSYEADGWEIASHTKSHYTSLDDSSEAVITSELQGSFNLLKAAGINVKNFGAPYGDDGTTYRRLMQTYYRSNRSANSVGAEKRGINNYPLATYKLRSVDYDGMANADSLNAAKALVDSANTGGRWIIFYIHASAFTADNITALANLITYVDSLDIDIVTVDQALDILGNPLDYRDANNGVAIGANGAFYANRFGTGAINTSTNTQAFIYQALPNATAGNSYGLRVYKEGYSSPNEIYFYGGDFYSRDASAANTNNYGVVGLAEKIGNNNHYWNVGVLGSTWHSGTRTTGSSVGAAYKAIGVRAYTTVTGTMTAPVENLMQFYGSGAVGSNVTNYYQMKLDAPTGTGTITNKYGIHQSGTNYKNFMGALTLTGNAADTTRYILNILKGTTSVVTADSIGNFNAIGAITENGIDVATNTDVGDSLALALLKTAIGDTLANKHSLLNGAEVRGDSLTVKRTGTSDNYLMRLIMNGVTKIYADSTGNFYTRGKVGIGAAPAVAQVTISSGSTGLALVGAGTVGMGFESSYSGALKWGFANVSGDAPTLFRVGTYTTTNGSDFVDRFTILGASNKAWFAGTIETSSDSLILKPSRTSSPNDSSLVLTRVSGIPKIDFLRTTTNKFNITIGADSTAQFAGVGNWYNFDKPVVATSFRMTSKPLWSTDLPNLVCAGAGTITATADTSAVSSGNAVFNRYSAITNEVSAITTFTPNQFNSANAESLIVWARGSNETYCTFDLLVKNKNDTTHTIVLNQADIGFVAANTWYRYAYPLAAGFTYTDRLYQLIVTAKDTDGGSTLDIGKVQFK